MRELVEQALEKIRPMLQQDGGNVELVGVDGTVVKVRLQGACHGCPMSRMTLKAGIEGSSSRKSPASAKWLPCKESRSIHRGRGGIWPAFL